MRTNITSYEVGRQCQSVIGGCPQQCLLG